MKERYVKYAMIIIGLLMIFYVFSNLYGNQILSNLISPFLALASGIFILTLIDKKSNFKLNWVLLALICLSWGILDFAWMILYNFMSVDPDESVLLMYAYTLPNIFLLMSVAIYFISNLKKWHKFQLTADAIFTTLIISVTIWFSLLRHLSFNVLSIHEIISTLLYVFTNIIALGFMAVLITSSRVNQKNNTLKIILFAYCVYVFADLSYVYAITLDQYTPNAVIDSFYLLSVFMFGYAAYLDWLKPTLAYKMDPKEMPHNAGRSKRLKYILIIPILLYFGGSLDFMVVLVLMFFIIIYQFGSSYVQIAIKNERLLYEQQRYNEQLEEIVAERTKDLEFINKQLETLSITDALSMMFNRRYLLNQLDQLIEKEIPFTLFYMDLDHFKVINDLHGHEMGDRVLKEIAKRLIKWQTENFIIARVGGDEFAIIYKQMSANNIQGIVQICYEINKTLEDKLIIDEYAFEVGVSIGISRYPFDALDRDSLVKYADLAMYQAKRKKDGNKYVFYSHSDGDTVSRKSKIEMMLKIIDFDHEFSLNFQPQFDVEGKQLIGVEALLRWNNPELGYVPPNEFIPIAEENNLIIRVGQWVIDTAFQQISEWNHRYESTLLMAINLSPLQLESPKFFPMVSQRLKAYKVDPSWIDFEITENSAMHSAVIMEERFNLLNDLGVQISIDDFGTGYSSLSYIKRFKINQLKIAKELVDHIDESESELLIIKAIILMAKGMGLKTIAEGVETYEQAEQLKLLSCDAVQGYLYSKPLPASDFEAKYLEVTN